MGIEAVKRCSRCKEEKPRGEFYSDKRTPDGLRYYCKDCAKRCAQVWNILNRERYNENMAAWRSANPEKVADTLRRCHLAREYRLTPEDVDALEVLQDGRCAICDREGKLVVDHDHVTGLVRELLCPNCNSMLGMAADDPHRLRMGAAYLARHQALAWQQ